MTLDGCRVTRRRVARAHARGPVDRWSCRCLPPTLLWASGSGTVVRWSCPKATRAARASPAPAGRGRELATAISPRRAAPRVASSGRCRLPCSSPPPPPHHNNIFYLFLPIAAPAAADMGARLQRKKPRGTCPATRSVTISKGGKE